MKNQRDEYIAFPQNTIQVLQKHDFRFRKQFGQNFLVDLHVLDKILRAAEIGPEDICIEIGPGIGSLTQVMAEQAKRVIAIEIDGRLLPILQENLSRYPNVTLVQGDFMELNLPDFLREQKVDQPVRVVANLPYYITTPLIMRLFESGIPLASVTVMVQEEVARRIQAGPGTKDYGALSLAVQYYAEPSIEAFVPPNCFIPRPGVGSAVIHLKRRKQPPVQTEEPALMFKMIRAAFGQRRKTLVNSLAGSQELEITKEEANELIREAGLPPLVRGETLTLEQFAQLTDRWAVRRKQ